MIKKTTEKMYFLKIPHLDTMSKSERQIAEKIMEYNMNEIEMPRGIGKKCINGEIRYNLMGYGIFFGYIPESWLTKEEVII